MRRNDYRFLIAILIALGLALPACSAVLDIDSLQKGDDGSTIDTVSPYDMSLGALRRRSAQRDLVILAAEGGGVNFRWRDLPGAPAAVDLSLGTSGAVSLETSGAVAQVFSRDHKPYLRVGLRVVALRADQTYRLTYRRLARGLRLELREARGGALVATQIVTHATAQPLIVSRPGRRIEVVGLRGRLSKRRLLQANLLRGAGLRRVGPTLSQVDRRKLLPPS